MNFRQFLTESDNSNIKHTLGKVPKSHRSLIDKYDIELEKGVTLNGGHIGEIDEKNKKIKISGPWYYGREFTLLHELGHAVWNYILPKKMKKEWSKVVKKTKKPRQHQGMEELFCQAYANFYCKNKIVIHDHDSWKEFVKNIPK
jgi:hypothetical protein